MLAVGVAGAAPLIIGVVRVGLVRVGLVANTKRPVPVSLEITPANSAEVVAAKSESLLAVRANVPVVSGKVHTLAADSTAIVKVPVLTGASESKTIWLVVAVRLSVLPARGPF